MRFSRNSLRLRLIAMAALWCAVALMAAWAVLSALFANQVRRGFDENLAAQLVGVVAASEWRPDTGLALRRPLPDPRYQQPLSGWYWQISSTKGALLRSRSLWDTNLAAVTVTVSLGKGVSFDTVTGPNGTLLRRALRQLTLDGAGDKFMYQLAVDPADMAADIDRFDRLLAVALAVLGFGLIAAMILQVQIGLRPLARIGKALADIRAGRADKLQGAFPSEIQPLADEIDTLLEHQAAVIHRARTHAGDLAHALKTPLAVLTNEAAHDPAPLAGHVRHQVVEMQRQMDRHLARARTAASAGVLGARCEVAPVLADLARVLDRLHAGRAISIKPENLPAAAFAGEREDLQEMLGNLMDNACQWAKVSVRVGVALRGDKIVLSIDDDGAGLSAQQRQEVMARGARLDESKPGSGLGLAIVADIAGLYGGELCLETSDLGGLSAQLILPRAP